MKPVGRIWARLFMLAVSHAWLWVASPGQAAEQSTFELGQTQVVLSDASESTALFYRSMRWNRAGQVWNVEVTVTNTGPQTLSGPFVLLVDGAENTSGLAEADGEVDGKSYLDLSPTVLGGTLNPGEVSLPQTLSLGRAGAGFPTLSARVFAGATGSLPPLAVARSLNEVGQPLGGAVVEEVGPDGQRTVVTEASSGLVSLGQGQGDHVWRFTASDHHPVWRLQTVADSGVTRVVSPRLTPVGGNTTLITPLDGGILGEDSIQISFAPGSVSSDQTATLTPLTAQTLPALLPLGWSPLQAFWFTLPGTASVPPRVAMAPWGEIEPAASAALVRWDPGALAWVVIEEVTGAGTNTIMTALAGTGAYALVVADQVPTAPPAPEVGAVLQGVSAVFPDGAALTAGGHVVPTTSPASLNPDEVTGQAEVTITNAAGPLPSGLVFECDIQEHYTFADGSKRVTPRYENFVVGYQRPGDDQSETLHCVFPVRPLRLHGPFELDEALVRVDVLTGREFPGTVLTPSGGQVAVGGIQVLAGIDDVARPQAATIRQLEPEYFTNLTGSLPLHQVFELNVTGILPGEQLDLQIHDAPKNAHLVLARVLDRDGVYGMEPIARLASDDRGRLTNLETNRAERLPGITGAGQYLVVEVPEPQALVQGVARNADDQPTAGLLVQAGPWSTFSREPDGRFQLIAPAGDAALAISDLNTGDSGATSVPISPGAGAVETTVSTSVSGPRVAQVTPADGATDISRVTAVTVEFTRPVNPATLLGTGIQLLDDGGQPVAAALSLNLANTTATLLPKATLAPATRFTVALSPDIADTNGRLLEGPTEFQFTTIALSERGLGAQLVIYEPGATNVPAAILDDIPAFTPGDDPFAIVVHGQPGVADPEVPVILVNESSGETQTVLSQPDGSFSSFINGTEEDFVSATFINLNGSRVYVPVSRQEFDNGFVGLYPQGGILEAQSDGGPVRVYIEPEAIKTKTKMRLKPLTLAQLGDLLGGVKPRDTNFLFAGALNLEVDGPAPAEGVNVTMPVDLDEVGYPADQPAEDVAVALTAVRDIQGVKAFEVLAPMTYVPSPAPAPVSGQVSAQSGGANEQARNGTFQAALGIIPGGDAADAVFRFVLAPMILGGKPIIVKGRVGSLPPEVAAGLDVVDRASMVVGFVSGVGDLGSVAAEHGRLTMAKPLGGAFITIHTLGTAEIGLPGRLDPGMVYATSDPDGYYLTMVPSVTMSYVVRATHPKYREKLMQPILGVLDLNLAAGVFYHNFFFAEPFSFESPPQVNISHSPLWPAPGQECELRISASHSAGAPPTIRAWVHSVTNLAAGVQVGLDDVKLLGDPVLTPAGANRTLWSQKLVATNALRATIRVVVASQNHRSHPTLYYPIDFAGQPPLTYTNMPSSVTNDVRGPYVTSTAPSDGAYVAEDGQITVHFNEPINRNVVSNAAGIRLSGPSAFSVPVVELSQDQRTLVLGFAGLQPDQDYALELGGQSVVDLSGNALDQNPATEEHENYLMSFHTAPVQPTDFAVANGKGTAISGNRLYALETGGDGYYLEAFHVQFPNSPPSSPVKVRLLGIPRDLAVISGWHYRLKGLQANGQLGPVETNELVAVMGGDLASIVDSDGAVSVPGQYLQIFRLVTSDEGVPRYFETVASAIVSYRVGAAVTKVRWSPPFLVYQEFAADIHQIGFINLQTLLIGFNATRAEAALFPRFGRPGEDLNGDGDYVDVVREPGEDPDSEGRGETLPLPERDPAEFYGKAFSLVVEGSTQKVMDFDYNEGILGVTLSGGFLRDRGGNVTRTWVDPGYRTLLSPGAENLDPQLATQLFQNGAHPKRVSIMTLPVSVSNRVDLLQIALVSLTPDFDGVQRLAVVDITLPEEPRLLNRIEFPEEIVGGQLQSVQRRTDGLLELYTSRNLFILSPIDLAAETPPEGQLHPSIVGFIPGAGSSTRSVASTPYGLRAVADGGRAQLVLSSPILQFVHFPEAAGLVTPATLVGEEETLAALFRKQRLVNEIVSARVHDKGASRSDLILPRPAAHYHVVVDMPGQVGREIEIGLESLNRAGRPLSNKGYGFAPVRAVSPETLRRTGQVLRPSCDAPIRSLKAYRMSDNPNSEFYNVFLSIPFALIYESVTLEELEQLKSTHDREILWGGAWLRAFLDPAMQVNGIVGPWAARIDGDRKEVQPVAQAMAASLNVTYAPGPNPPPAGGTVALSGTFGSVTAHNGEVRMDATDISLPSPRMGIEIVRTIGGQDNYDGPFGLGWDFNYNQRVTELKQSLFPYGLQMPLITRGDTNESVVALTGDLLLNSGEGRVYVFHHEGTNMPPEFAQDPLVKALDWEPRASDYYLPEAGVFDVMVKFIDGYYERLTPGGTRFRYNNSGQLEEIIDRWPQNRHVLDYDRNGWLIRIRDKSVPGDRFLDFGYYRSEGDPAFRGGLDEVAPNKFTEGKIRRLRDYAGRDVLYFYDDEGLLIRRESFEVAGENGGYRGRNQTHYNYDHCKIVGVSVGEAGIPLFNAKTENSTEGVPVTQSATGIGGPVTASVPLNNSAELLDGLVSAGTQADGRKTEFKFDKFGYTSSVKLSGALGEDSEVKPVNNEFGQVLSVTYPEGRVETHVYDTNNPVFRSRGNLLSTKINPGPRGGEGYTETFSYDPRYNLPSGAWKNADGFTITYTLRADGREVASIRHGDAGTETFSYNSRGQLLSHTDIRGVQTGYTFQNATGFVQTRKQGDHAYTYGYGGDVASLLGRPSSIKPPRGATTTFKYNANLQPVEIRRAGQVTLQAYDEQGRNSFISEYVGDGKTKETRFSFDTKGFLTNATVAGVEVKGGDTTLSYSFTPDELSRTKSILHPGGTLQEFEYDKRNNVIKMTLGGQYVEEYIRDRHGNVEQLKQGGDVVVTTEYDGLDRPKLTTRKTGTAEYTTTQEYWPGSEPKVTTINDPRDGIVLKHSYPQIDAVGRPIRRLVDGTTIAPSYRMNYPALSQSVTGPRQTVRRTWDTADYPTGYSDAIVNATITTDGNGNVEKMDRQEDGASYADTFTYDNLDHRKTASDNFGPVATFTPREDGNPVEVINARNNRTALEHSVLGEVLQRRRADGMEFRFQHDEQRQIDYSGDPGAGFNFDYDDIFRRTKQTLRNGAEVVYSDFDPRNLPRSITIPGGTVARAYDLQRRLTSQTTSYQGTSYEFGYAYDALDRHRVTTYQPGGGTANTATCRYDRAGPLLSVRYQEGGGDYTIGYSYYSDTSRKTVTYPSGVTVTEERDTAGRLIGIADAAGNICHVDQWQGNVQPKVVRIGSTLEAVNQYDTRGRLTGCRVTRSGDEAVLVHMRYQYDAANNVEIRQYLHRNGKADSFGYDNGERVRRALMGTLPLTGGGFGPADYERSYTYEPNGLDHLVSVTTTSRVGVVVPPFASSWTGHDAFLQPTVVDGFNRGAADPMGNVAGAQLRVRVSGMTSPVPVGTTLTHNGLGQLVRLARQDDGVMVDNDFRPNGLRYAQRLSGAGPSLERHFVYDKAGRLLEEYEGAGEAGTLVGRYYYMAGDAPVAADLLVGTNGLQRFYYLRDVVESVLAVADASGQVVERMWYDPFGQPVIEPRDDVAPRIKSVAAGEGGALLVELSEPISVNRPDPGPGAGIVLYDVSAATLEGALTVSTGSPPAVVRGSIDLVGDLPGYAPDTVLRFAPGLVLTGEVSVALSAGVLTDEWGNPNAAQTLTFTNEVQDVVAGTIFHEAPNGTTTAAGRIARSTVGSPFLFQGQYFDYDTGLVYMRARFYDPFSGMFLEPDPMGYEDSVNLYCGLGNNPATMRDPSGTRRGAKPMMRSMGSLAEREERLAKRGLRFKPEYRPKEMRIVEREVVRTPTDTPVDNVAGGLKPEHLGDIPSGHHIPQKMITHPSQFEPAEYDVFVLGHMRSSVGRHQGDVLATTDQFHGRNAMKSRNFRGDVEAAAADPNQRIFFNIEGFPGTTPQEKLKGALHRRKHLSHLPKEQGGPTLTDWEVETLHDAGRLGDVTLVHGPPGANKFIRNPYAPDPMKRFTSMMPMPSAKFRVSGP